MKGIEYAREKSRPGDTYVFADMDIRPARDWLSHITLPLADPTVFAVSGFRSLIPRTHQFSDHLHATFSALQAMAMTKKTYAAMWGGSMALTRKAFEKAEVGRKWSTAMVDDMSLTWIIRRDRLKRIFSPDCLVHSRETYSELNRGMEWIVRQTQYSAIYLRPYAAMGLSLNSILALCMYLLTAAAICLLGVFVKQKGVKIRWFLYAPAFHIIGTFCGWVGFFSKRLKWANIL